ncbi:hypothetical protein ACW4TU_41560 [Streptomyces sp. QTS52]
MEDEDRYAEDESTIERELTEAQVLGFNEYVGFTAHYGVRLRELSRKHENPEAAYRYLLKYSDDFLEDFPDQ